MVLFLIVILLHRVIKRFGEIFDFLRVISVFSFLFQLFFRPQNNVFIYFMSEFIQIENIFQCYFWSNHPVTKVGNYLFSCGKVTTGKCILLTRITEILN